MSIQIFRDVEEALAREVRRITFNNTRSPARVVLQDTFDPFTGELVSVPIEPSFYDSSADANNIQYPNFFIKLLRTREDRYSKRVVPPYGDQIVCPDSSAPKAYEIILNGVDGTILSPGNEVKSSIFQVKKIQPGFLLRLLSGNNKGTYIVDSITVSNTGPHSIFLKSELIVGLPELLFNSVARKVVFSSSVDLNTVAAGDLFEDSIGSTFPITSVDTSNNLIVIGGISLPDLNSNGKIVRTGNVLKNSDPSYIRYLIMDPSKPVNVAFTGAVAQGTSSVLTANWSIPLDAYYLIRIDSKERASHVDVLNRVWEEFNPPRSGLPVIIRSNTSEEQLLSADVTTGGSSTIAVADSSKFNVGDKVYILDDLNPTRDEYGTFQEPFASIIADIPTATSIVLTDVVPDTFKTSNNSKIVSNAQIVLHMFHFVDHSTKDNEAAQYWVHEFTFWVQIWVDKFGLSKSVTAVTDIAAPIENMDGDIIIGDS